MGLLYKTIIMRRILTIHVSVFLTASLLFLSSCKKDKEAISNTPEIKLIETSPTQIKEYKDKVVFNVYYKDGDGDIGENSDGIKNLFVTDSRNSITYEFRVKQLAPSGSSVSIEGNLMIELNTVAILNGSNSELVEYSIYLKDRAGNASNTVTTSGLTIIK